MKFRSDDIVVTCDGKEHRVLYPCKDGENLYCKPGSGKRKDGYKVRINAIKEHRPHVMGVE